MCADETYAILDQGIGLIDLDTDELLNASNSCMKEQIISTRGGSQMNGLTGNAKLQEMSDGF